MAASLKMAAACATRWRPRRWAGCDALFMANAPPGARPGPHPADLLRAHPGRPRRRHPLRDRSQPQTLEQPCVGGDGRLTPERRRPGALPETRLPGRAGVWGDPSGAGRSALPTAGAQERQWAMESGLLGLQPEAAAPARDGAGTGHDGLNKGRRTPQPNPSPAARLGGASATAPWSTPPCSRHRASPPSELLTRQPHRRLEPSPTDSKPHPPGLLPATAGRRQTD